METISIRARNNLDIPIRLALTNTDEILITVGGAGVKLSGFYGVCVDVDLSPNKEWSEIGSLNISTKSHIKIQGQPESETHHDINT